MHHIVYLSAAVEAMNEQALKELLVHSRRRNQERSITGLLLYADGQILQVLEGPESAVRAMYKGISQDCRHAHVQKIADGPIARRLFPDWSMGFLAASPADFARVAGYRNPASSGFMRVRPTGMDWPFYELLRDFVGDKVLTI